MKLLQRRKLIPRREVLAKLDFGDLLPRLEADGVQFDWSEQPAETREATAEAIDGALAAVCDGDIGPLPELLDVAGSPGEVLRLAKARLKRQLADTLERHDHRLGKSLETADAGRLTKAELLGDVDAINEATSDASRAALEDFNGFANTLSAFASEVDREWRASAMEASSDSYVVAKDRWTAACSQGREAAEKLLGLAASRPESPATLALIEVAQNAIATRQLGDKISAIEIAALEVTTRKTAEAVTPTFVRQARELGQAASNEKQIADMRGDWFDSSEPQYGESE